MQVNTFSWPKIWKQSSALLLILLAFGLMACGPSPAKTAFPESPEIRPKLSADISKTRIVILKSAYKLQLWEGNKLLRTYPIVLGFDPVADKWQEGDGRTPEGHFKVKTKYPHAKWSKFIWIDYPNESSYTKFNARKAEGKLKKEATIGGEIGIHGTPEGREDLIDDKYNWTLGCISLKRSDVDELYDLVQDGSPIEIKH